MTIVSLYNIVRGQCSRLIKSKMIMAEDFSKIKHEGGGGTIERESWNHFSNRD